MTPWQETAALRDFKPAYDRLGSISTKLAAAADPCTSAVSQDRTQIQCVGARSDGPSADIA
jgi:hypothetical protein